MCGTQDMRIEGERMNRRRESTGQMNRNKKEERIKKNKITFLTRYSSRDVEKRLKNLNAFFDCVDSLGDVVINVRAVEKCPRTRYNSTRRRK